MKKTFYIVLFFLCLGFFKTTAQTDTLSLESMLDQTPTEIKLLPDRMMPTQALFWGKKGLLRITGIAPLNEKTRTVELKIRRTMLITHQIVGYATLAGMIAQGIVGAKLYKQKVDGVYDEQTISLHKALGTGVNIAYFTDAGLSLFSPPPVISYRTKGINSIKLHKGLAVVHLTAMITTNILANLMADPNVDRDYKPYHRAAAYTAFGAFATAMLVMKF
jgi:hypothetical protein